MTDAEREPLNERIALRLGWTFHPENPFEERWLHPSRLWSLHTHPPDFTRKWEHTGPLLIELYKNNWRLCWGSDVFWMEPPPQITWDWHDGCAEEAPEAIAPKVSTNVVASAQPFALKSKTCTR
ncbi:hypothetical protein LCGC14_2666890 [marine sediment metagenome]|uniref:Uncharacterized protein n=1 Tax=marine sediment metagenome TaxID=412755 RepID=A0A0F8ZQ81_9ZZZZ